ncbi:MAG: ABC transporter ATP-binding protein [Alphaproteobacteria bacterium]
MPDEVLQLDNVTKTYGGFHAVRNLSFSVQRGDIFGFLGPNGAGKTTTLRMILDIIRPTAGRLSVLGEPSALKVRHRIGYLPEERGLYKKMTAVRAISYFARLKGMPRRAAKARARELLERFGLGEFADTRIMALSRGMAQKVQVLTAIAHDPELIILDEPFSGLDPVNQLVLEQMIRELAERGRTIMFSTHVMEHAERLCNHLLLLANGEKLFDGTLEEARAATPRRVRLEAEEDLSALGALESVASVHPPNGQAPSADGEDGHPYWEIVLARGADPQDILKACFDRRIALTRFDQSEPGLHEIFVTLVGPGAMEARQR